VENFNPNHDKLGRFAKSPFKNSKVQQAVYHVSPNDFDKFSLDYFGGTDAGSLCKGLYFENKANKKYGNKVYKSYVNIQNPFYYENEPRRFSINFKDLKNPQKIQQQKEEITQQLIKEGYDGVIMYNTQFVVFNPEQVKVIEKYGI
jgi:hypothetical protein